MDKPIRRKRVLFLCVGNSCRSQIAEALTNHLIGDKWVAFSGGTTPASEVHPLVFRVLAEIDIQHEGHPKFVQEFKDQSFDLVITVCGEAEENCPVWLGKGKKVHLAFPDPAKSEGDEGARLAAFRKVRDDMKREIIPLLLKE